MYKLQGQQVKKNVTWKFAPPKWQIEESSTTNQWYIVRWINGWCVGSFMAQVGAVQRFSPFFSTETMFIFVPKKSIFVKKFFKILQATASSSASLPPSAMIGACGIAAGSLGSQLPQLALEFTDHPSSLLLDESAWSMKCLWLSPCWRSCDSWLTLMKHMEHRPSASLRLWLSTWAQVNVQDLTSFYRPSQWHLPCIHACNLVENSTKNQPRSETF